MIIGISGKIGSGKDEVGKMIQYLTTVDRPTYSEYKKRHIEGNQEIINPTFKNKKFADKLKDIVCILLGCTREQLEDREFKEKELGEEWWYYYFEGVIKDTITQQQYQKLTLGQQRYFTLVRLTPRKILQLMGTECGRVIIHPQIWVNSFLADYKEDLILSPLGSDNVIGSRWIATDMRFPNELKAVEDRGFTIRINRGSYKVKEGVAEHPSETALDNAKFKHTLENSEGLEELYHKVKEILVYEGLL